MNSATARSWRGREQWMNPCSSSDTPRVEVRYHPVRSAVSQVVRSVMWSKRVIGERYPCSLVRRLLAGRPPGSDGSWLAQAVPEGVRDGLCPVAGADLREQVVDVALHRPLADHQAKGDLGVGQSPGHQR